jgi:hypothetical protein
MEETSHTETWSPAKIALADLVVAISACRIRALPARAGTIRTASLLYALIDPKRRNRPTAAQLREAAPIAREMGRDIVLMAKRAERTADQLEERTSRSGPLDG